MNTNASMYVRSYKARQGREWKNEGGTESGRNRQESSREEAELVRAYDEKRRPLPRKKGDGNGSTITWGGREEGLIEDGWIEWGVI